MKLKELFTRGVSGLAASTLVFCVNPGYTGEMVKVSSVKAVNYTGSSNGYEMTTLPVVIDARKKIYEITVIDVFLDEKEDLISASRREIIKAEEGEEILISALDPEGFHLVSNAEVLFKVRGDTEIKFFYQKNKKEEEQPKDEADKENSGSKDSGSGKSNSDNGGSKKNKSDDNKDNGSSNNSSDNSDSGNGDNPGDNGNSGNGDNSGNGSSGSGSGGSEDNGKSKKKGKKASNKGGKKNRNGNGYSNGQQESDDEGGQGNEDRINKASDSKDDISTPGDGKSREGNSGFISSLFGDGSDDAGDFFNDSVIKKMGTGIISAVMAVALINSGALKYWWMMFLMLFNRSKRKKWHGILTDKKNRFIEFKLGKGDGRLAQDYIDEFKEPVTVFEKLKESGDYTYLPCNTRMRIEGTGIKRLDVKADENKLFEVLGEMSEGTGEVLVTFYNKAAEFEIELKFIV